MPNVSTNPCYTPEWIYYHYARRKDYLQWCKKNHVDPCPHGGQGLTLRACGKLAGVSQVAIFNWLSVLKIRMRDKGEAQTGDYNHRRYMETTDKEKRQSRDKFFEQYRSGTINIVAGGRRFSNGVEVDRQETLNRRTRQKARKSQLDLKGL